MPRRTDLPPNVSAFLDRHGKQRFRYRRVGAPQHYFHAKPGTPAFWDEYRLCVEGSRPHPARPSLPNNTAHTISALIDSYLRSSAFKTLAPSSKKTYRSTLGRFEREHGHRAVATLQRKHVRAILEAMSDTPAAANKLLDKIRLLMRHAMDLEWRTDDPTFNIRGFSKKTEGFRTWTEADIAQFERVHPVGSTARLAFALLLHTGQRRSDMVRMAPGDVVDGCLVLRQQKTGSALRLPMTGELADLIKDIPIDQRAFLLTEKGKPFTANGFGNKFREWCDGAGLAELSAHGLRKAMARRLAETGASASQIKAVTGHTTLTEVARYTAAADQPRLAGEAIARMQAGLAKKTIG